MKKITIFTIIFVGLILSGCTIQKTAPNNKNNANNSGSIANSKKNDNCGGKYLYYNDHKSECPATFLEKKYDLASIRDKAISKGYEAKLDAPTPENANRVTINVTVSEKEKYEITLGKKGCPEDRQEIDVVQWGSCDLSDDYIKTKVREILTQLNIETTFIDKAGVHKNYSLQMF